MNRLAIISTHPIQYNAPIFKLLAERGNITVKVFYTWHSAQGKIFDPGFGKVIEWDIPLLEGYDYAFVKNKKESERKSFWSIQNPELVKEIESFRPTAVLVFGWNYYSHLQVIKCFSGKVPVYFRGDSTLLDKDNSVKTLLAKKLLSVIYKYVDSAFYVGENNRQYYLKNGLKSRQLLFAPHAIDNERFSTAEKEVDYEEEVRKKKLGLGIPENEIVFLFVGKLNPKKNPQLLMDAFLDMNRNDAHLIFVGNGALEEQLKEKKANNAKIHLLDFHNQKEMPLVYRLADVFVLPSKGPGETWGLAVNEAMASKKPVLVSDRVGCAVDLVKSKVNGFIFKHDSVTDLKEKLSLFKSKEICEKMGEESFNIVKDYNFERICEVLESEIKGIAK
jgi:glycosyltransferase involved in cell wall biosynthesis